MGCLSLLYSFQTPGDAQYKTEILETTSIEVAQMWPDHDPVHPCYITWICLPMLTKTGNPNSQSQLIGVLFTVEEKKVIKGIKLKSVSNFLSLALVLERFT